MEDYSTRNINEMIARLENQLNNVISGKPETVRLLLTALLAGGHVLIEDVPGVGKTTIANALSRSTDLDFGRIQFTPDTLPGDVLGVSIYNPKSGEFVFNKGAIMHNIILADEINRTSPKTQASLLEAMEEKQVTIDGNTYTLESPFMVIATQNPIDFVGTYNLPEAQLDRFMMKISIGYPDKDSERDMVLARLKKDPLPALAPVVSKEELIHMINEVVEVSVHDDLITYIIELATATRNDDSVSLGVSPRAVLALIAAAKATAYLDNRTYCIPDDILKIIHSVWGHRLVLSMDAKLAKTPSHEVLAKIIKTIKVPVL